MQNEKTTRRGQTQKENAVIKNGHSKLDLESHHKSLRNNEILNQVQDDSLTTRGFTFRPSSPRSVGMRGIGADPALYPALQACGMTKRSVRGFTLIELLVVVLIIGILAAVAVPQYNKAVKKAQGTEALTVIDALDKALHAYYLEHGTYADVTLEKLNVDIPEQKHIRYVSPLSSFGFESGRSLPELWRGNSDVTIYLGLKGNVMISISWQDNMAGKSDGIKCHAYGVVSCSEYFNCNTEPIRMVDTGSGIKQVGGGCLLK